MTLLGKGSFNSVRRFAAAASRKSVPMSQFDKQAILPYEQLLDNLSVVRKRLAKPMNVAEKILYSHLDQPATQEIARGKTYLKLRPDRVAMQDATAQVSSRRRRYRTR